MKTRRQLFKKSLAMVGVSALAAVNASQAQAQANPTSATSTVGSPNAPKTKGLFTFKMFGVTGVDSHFSQKWTELTLKDKNSGRTVTIRDPLQTSNHSHFTALLDPGTYSITGISVPGPSVFLWGFIVEAILRDLNTSSTALSKDFEVRAGEIVNLGCLVFALFYEHNQTTNKQVPRFVTASLPPEMNERIALEGGSNTFKADLGHFLAAKGQPLAPLPAMRVFPKTLEQFVPLFSRFAQTLTLNNGDAIFSAPLGMLMKRSKASGQWSYHWSGRFEAIDSVVEMDDGRLISLDGSEGMTVWSQGLLEASWRRFAIGEDKVWKIAPMGTHGLGVIQYSDFNNAGLARRVELYTRADLENDTPHEKVVVLGPGAQGLMPMQWDGKKLQVYYPVQGISRTTEVHSIDPVTKAKELVKLPTWALAIERFDSQWRMTRMNGGSFYFGQSVDQGKNWAMSDKALPGSVIMTDEKNGFTVKVLKSGWSRIDAAILHTRDAGATWQETPGVIVMENVAMIRGAVADDKEWIVLTLIKGFFRSTDSGKTWTAFLPPYVAAN